MTEKAWFRGDPGSLYATARAVERGQQRRRFLSYYTALAYYQEPITIGGAASSPRVSPRAYLDAIDAKKSFNVLKSVISAASAQVVRVPAIRAVTMGGDWRLRIAARKLSTLCTGLVQSSGLAEDALQVFVDGCLYPVGGVLWSFTGKKELVAERVRPDYVVYNAAEGRRPANLFIHMPEPREAVRAKFGSKAAAKATAYTSRDAMSRFDPGMWDGSLYEADLVDTVRGWHLACDDAPGRFVMSSGDEIFADEAYDLPEFPFVPYRWDESFTSWGGTPAGWDLLPYQVMANQYLDTIINAQAKAAIPRVYIQKGSEVQRLTTTVAEIVEYIGQPPVVQPGQALPSEYYNFFDKLLTSAYEFMGVSTAFATAQKPAGLNSGVALRESSDISESRLRKKLEGFEDFFSRCMQVAMMMMEREYGSRSNVIEAPGTKLIEQIDWKDLKVLENKYTLRAWPVSQLPQTPAGRLQYVSELREVFGDAMPLDKLAQLLNVPDLEAWNDEATAVADLTDRIVSKALDDGEYMAPEPYLGTNGLKLLVETATKRYLRTLCDNVPPPPEHFEACRRVVERAKYLLTKISDPGPMQAPAPPAGQPGVGAPAAPLGGLPSAGAAPADLGPAPPAVSMPA